MSNRSGTNQTGLTPNPLLKKMPKGPIFRGQNLLFFNANGSGLFDAPIFELSLWQGAILVSRMLCSVSFLNRLPFERAFLGLAQAAFADKGVDKTNVY